MPKDSLQGFLGEPVCTVESLFVGGRFPNVVVATDGTVLATWGKDRFEVKRSEDGGRSWQQTMVVADPGFHGGGVIVNECDIQR